MKVYSARTRQSIGGGFVLFSFLAAVSPDVVAQNVAGVEAQATLPPGVVARLDSRDITVGEYTEYLFAVLGKSKLGDYIDRVLLEAEAARVEVSMEPAQVEELLRQEIDHEIQALYQGDEARFLAELARARLTRAEYEARRRQGLYFRGLGDAVILKRRSVEAADVRREFERTYGADGVEYVLQHLLVATGRFEAGQPPRGSTEALARAEKARAELQAGADFPQQVKAYSDDPLTRRNEGRLPHYRRTLLGEEFHRAVLALTPERPLSGVIASARGYHIVKLIEKRTVRFEDVQKGIEEALLKRAVTQKERQDLLASLRSGARIEGL